MRDLVNEENKQWCGSELCKGPPCSDTCPFSSKVDIDTLKLLILNHEGQGVFKSNPPSPSHTLFWIKVRWLIIGSFVSNIAHGLYSNGVTDFAMIEMIVTFMLIIYASLADAS